MAHGILLVDLPNGAGYTIIILGVSWIGDASAYYVGSRFGRHKVTEVLFFDSFTNELFVFI